MEKKKIAITGGIVGMFSQVITLLMKFVVRTFVIRIFGVEILGLEGVLLDIVSTLSLAELGITAAMLYRLYEPVAKNDNKRIGELLATYKLVYSMISVIIVVFAVIIGALLPKIITGVKLDFQFIYIAFILQVANTVASYMLAYQRVLLNADQRKTYCMVVDLIANVCFSVLKLLAIVIWHNYFVYLALSIVQTISANVWLKIHSRKLYGSKVFQYSRNPLDFKNLIDDAKQVLGGKLAAYAYNSTGNIVVSICISTVAVGYLSNYKYIAQSLKTLVNSSMAVMQPLIGRVLNDDNKPDKTFDILCIYSFVRIIIGVVTVVPFVLLSDLFVQIWTGNAGYVLSRTIVFLLAIDYYIGCVYGPLGEYMLGKGMFKEEKNITIKAAIMNLLLCIIGARFFGYNGLLFGTAVTQAYMWIGKGRVIFNKLYDSKKEYVAKYMQLNLLGLLSIFFSIVLSEVILSQVVIDNSIVMFIIGGVITVVLAIILLILLSYRTNECKYIINMCKSIVRKKG